jgi:type VI secretion system secreted protein Hcp
MNLGSAKGDVTAQSNQGWIEVLDCSWSMSRRIRSAVGVGKSRESTTPYVGEISVTKFVDSASSAIQQYAFKAIVNDCTIQYIHTDIGGGKVFRSLLLADCIISSVNSDGGSQERPKEYLTLNFTEITVSDTVYTDTDSAGTDSKVVYSLEQSTTL